MLRAAAKNHEAVLVVVDPADYPLLLAELDGHHGGSDFATRARLAAKAFAHTAGYDTMVAAWLGAQHPATAHFPATLPLVFDKVQDLRYGENPHQAAAFYRDLPASGASVCTAQLLQGKDLSFNNIADADTAIECVRQFEHCACVIVKHANPCGVAVAAASLAAYERAYRTDPTSAFGGIIAFNRELDAATAAAITERQFVEVLAVPALSAEAARLLAAKPNVRVLLLGELDAPAGRRARVPQRHRRAAGADARSRRPARKSHSRCRRAASRPPPSSPTCASPGGCAKFVKSNAIVFARDGATLGVGRRADEPRLLHAHRRHEGQRRDIWRSPARCWRPMPSCRSATTSTSPPATASAPSSSPAAASATRRSSLRPTSTTWRWCSPACATSVTRRRSRELSDLP